MKKILFLIKVFVVILCFFPLICLSNPVKQLVVFGDSLSDNGNLYKLTLHIVPKNPPYFNGQFSNGKVWNMDLAPDLKLDTSNHAQYLNFAYGGADAEYAGWSPNLPIQVQIYLKEHNVPGPNTLFSIWAGGDDYLGAKLSDTNVDQITTNTVNSIETQIETLIAAGAKNFLIFNLPDLSATIQTQRAMNPKYTQLEQNLTYEHNKKLAVIIEKLKTEYAGKVKFVTVDIFTMFNTLINSGKYKTTSACYTGNFWLANSKNNFARSADFIKLEEQTGININNNVALKVAYENGLHVKEDTVCTDPQAYIFWDSIHPTASIHAILAKNVLAVLKENGYTAL